MKIGQKNVEMKLNVKNKSKYNNNYYNYFSSFGVGT